MEKRKGEFNMAEMFSPESQSNVDSEVSKRKLTFIKILGTLIFAIFVLGFAFEGYTYLMGRFHKVCGFDGVYTYVEDSTTVACIFDGDEMVLYTTDGINESRISYTFLGYYYNRGLFGRFLDLNNKWVKIPDAEKAGQFYATCKNCVSTSAWGDFLYLDEDEIKATGEKDGVDYSKTFFFKKNGDLLTLILVEDDGSFSIPLTKMKVLTGDIGETVEYLDSLWEYKFG